MNMHTPLEATPRLVRLNQLYLHDMNPRQNGSDEDTAAMAQSIAIKVADIMAIPLARISVDKRDMLSWFAIITLFNALGVFVVFVLLR